MGPQYYNNPDDPFEQSTIDVITSASQITVQMTDYCIHVEQARPVTPKGIGCEECLRMGDTWVHLRLCLYCGNVGCCDSSKNKHATKHFRASSHPVIKSFEPGEEWGYCYVDEIFFEQL